MTGKGFCFTERFFNIFHMGVSKNRGIPKSSLLIRFSIINHPFWGTPIFGNIHISWAKRYLNSHPELFQGMRWHQETTKSLGKDPQECSLFKLKKLEESVKWSKHLKVIQKMWDSFWVIANNRTICLTLCTVYCFMILDLSLSSDHQPSLQESLHCFSTLTKQIAAWCEKEKVMSWTFMKPFFLQEKQEWGVQ